MKKIEDKKEGGEEEEKQKKRRKEKRTEEKRKYRVSRPNSQLFKINSIELNMSQSG